MPTLKESAIGPMSPIGPIIHHGAFEPTASTMHPQAELLPARVFAAVVGCLAVPGSRIDYGRHSAYKMSDGAVCYTRPNANGDQERFIVRIPEQIAVVLEQWEEDV